MKRALLALIAAITGLVLVLSFRSHSVSPTATTIIATPAVNSRM